MRDVTILPSEKIVGEKALEIFNKMGISCEITDFSVLLGGYSSKTSDTRSKSMGWWWTSTCTKDTSSHVAPEFVDFYPINIATVFEGNRLGESPANSTNRGVRPAIKYSLIQPICKVKINKYGVKETLYGDYPQTLVDESLSSTLEKLYKSNDLKKTGKHYSIKSENLDLVSKSDSLDEFDYNNERYVRFAPHLPIGPVETLSNGKKIISDKGYWIHVEPIKWFIDEKEDIALCEKIMFSGHSFSEEKGNKEIKFENTEIFKFLNKKFVKEIA